jgi:ABC-type multidrug transport system fused ATPase/permease subunit
VLYAPLGFFLQNPVGEMLVAFTKDQDIIDENLVDTLHYLGIYGLIMLSTVITVSVTIPMFSVFGGVLFFVTGVMLYFYLPAATTLKKQKTETAGERQIQFGGWLINAYMVPAISTCSNSSDRGIVHASLG